MEIVYDKDTGEILGEFDGCGCMACRLDMREIELAEQRENEMFIEVGSVVAITVEGKVTMDGPDRMRLESSDGSFVAHVNPEMISDVDVISKPAPDVCVGDKFKQDKITYEVTSIRGDKALCWINQGGAEWGGSFDLKTFADLERLDG